jgi:hypothetical protein
MWIRIRDFLSASTWAMFGDITTIEGIGAMAGIGDIAVVITESGSNSFRSCVVL